MIYVLPNVENMVKLVLYDKLPYYQLPDVEIQFKTWIAFRSILRLLKYCWFILYSSAKFQVTPGLKKYVLRRQYPMNTLEEMERKVSYIERVQNQRWWKCKNLHLRHVSTVKILQNYRLFYNFRREYRIGTIFCESCYRW